MSFATEMLFMGGFIATPSSLASVANVPAVSSAAYATPSVAPREPDAPHPDARALSADCQLCA